jgi:hypothetical protein
MDAAILTHRESIMLVNSIWVYTRKQRGVYSRIALILTSEKPPKNLGFQGVYPELPIRIELMTFSLRVKRSTD